MNEKTFTGAGRSHIKQAVNSSMVQACWHIGRLIRIDNPRARDWYTQEAINITGVPEP